MAASASQLVPCGRRAVGPTTSGLPRDIFRRLRVGDGVTRAPGRLSARRLAHGRAAEAYEPTRRQGQNDRAEESTSVRHEPPMETKERGQRSARVAPAPVTSGEAVVI